MSVTNPTLIVLAAGVLVAAVPLEPEEVPESESSLPQAVTTAQDATKSSRASR